MLMMMMKIIIIIIFRNFRKYRLQSENHCLQFFSELALRFTNVPAVVCGTTERKRGLFSKYVHCRLARSTVNYPVSTT